MKCDPSVKNVQKEALSVMSKATELFVAYVARQSGVAAAKRGVKTVKGADFVKAIHEDDILCFLRDDFPLSSLKPKGAKRNLGDNGGDEEPVKKVRGNEIVASGKSSLLNYFGGNKNSA